MWRTFMVAVLVLALPASASAGPLKDAIEKAGRELASQQTADTGNRGRFWTSIALIAGGGVLTTLGALEVGDDESGPDDGEDFDDSDDGEDSDGWGGKALLGSGIAATALGGVLLWRNAGARPQISVQPKRVSVKHTVKF